MDGCTLCGCIHPPIWKGIALSTGVYQANAHVQLGLQLPQNCTTDSIGNYQALTWSIVELQRLHKDSKCGIKLNHSVC